VDEITKNEFLKKFQHSFFGNDIDGYTFKGANFSVSEIRDITNGFARDLDELEELCNDSDNDDWTELHNAILANLFGDGENFQGSYEEKAGSGESNWFLDFGKIEIAHVGEGFSYSDVRFYRDH
jgi:hypothetical protein